MRAYVEIEFFFYKYLNSNDQNIDFIQNDIFEFNLIYKYREENTKLLKTITSSFLLLFLLSLLLAFLKCSIN